MKKREYYEIRVLCGLFYMICLLQFWGISFHQTDGRSPEKNQEKIREEAQEVRETVDGDITSVTKEAPKIAITFDDGPNSHCTGRLLDGLKKRGVKATFFLIGKNVKENPDLVKRLDEEGHLIGNHTYNHVEITRISDEEAKKEITDTDEAICAITGKHVEYMRPPFGLWQEELEQELNVMPVMWSVDPLDWTTKNVDEIVNKVVTEAGENDIILLHDCYDSSVDAALRIIDTLQKKGFEFVTADELIMD
ncbi:MAG: polysaccharide deacetylase family protein [Dorea sp.]|nr:polysaccharide deacetylase family protein [Dorea sp.]MCI9228946.1 polysaccharide deacetylase family protein [Dorea sp.]